MTWNATTAVREISRAERGAYSKPWGDNTRVALVYPNSYNVGMSNLGLHIIYKLINERGDSLCERFFLPDKSETQKSPAALLSVESQAALAKFNLVAFAVSFEMDYFNILDILSRGRVPLLAAERTAFDPIVIAGGPCATFNPEPLADFIDAFIIGEGEVTMGRVLDVYAEGRRGGWTRQRLLKECAGIEGVYVPCFYHVCYNDDGTIAGFSAEPGAPATVKRQWVENIDDHQASTVVVTDHTEFKDMFLVEIARGCGRHCRFCMAGYCFRRPRNRSLEALNRELDKAQAYGKKVGLMGAAISDYPYINELCALIRQRGLKMSVASFRADSVSPELVEALAASGLKTLTLAPEAGSERMRRVINKGINEAHVRRAIDLGAAAGIANFRVYLMVGLPGETEADIDAIIDLALTLRSHMDVHSKGGLLTLSINPFVPKPFTPFQWTPMASLRLLEQYFKRIRTALKNRRGISVLTESLKDSFAQAILARGDRRLGAPLLRAWQNGGVKAFKRELARNGGADFYLYRQRRRDELMPWQLLDMGFSAEYLYEEWQKAEREQFTPPCFAQCRRCGVCR